jgi:ribosomal protein L13
MDSPINEFGQQNFTKLKIYENDQKQEQVNKQIFLAKFAQQ